MSLWTPIGECARANFLCIPRSPVTDQQMPGERRVAELKSLIPLLVFFATYLAGAELGQALSFPGSFASFWPPSGIYLAGLILTPVRLWPAVCATALAAATASNVLLQGMPLLVNVGYWLSNTTDALLAAAALRWWCGSSFSLARLRDVILLCGCSVAAGAAGALIGAATSTLAFHEPFWEAWRTWWLACSVGVLVVGPVFLAMADHTLRRQVRWFDSLEEGTAWILLILAAQWLPSGSDLPEIYVLFPIMLWITVRFEVKGAAWGNFLLSIASMWNIVANDNPGEQSLVLQLFEAQTFIAVSAASFLMLACALAERRRAAERSRENEESYRDLFDNMSDLVHSVAPDGRLLYVNRAWHETLGYSAEDVQKLNLLQIVHPDHVEKCRALLEQIQARGPLHAFETCLMTSRGGVIEVEGNISYQYRSQMVVGTRTIFRDVTGRKLAERKASEYQRQLESMNSKLRSLSVTDGLTQLHNRRYFQQALSEEHERSRRYEMPLSLLLLDVDHFKKFNDTFGHLAGDAVLCKVAQILRENARASDVVARFGGEEFAVLLPVTDHAGAMMLAERYRAAIENGTWNSRPVTVSVGVSTTIGSQLDVAGLIRVADDALYLSKQNGRNCVTSALKRPSSTNGQQVLEVEV